MKVSGLWMRHVALGLLCLLLLSAFQSASALPGKGRGISSYRSGSGKGSHGVGVLLSGHDSKKNNGKSDDKKHGLGGLFGHDDKKNNGKHDDKKHGLGGLLSHDDKKTNGNGKPGDKNPGKGSKHGKDKCKTSKGGSSRGRKPSRRDITARDLLLRARGPPVPQDGMQNAPHGQTLHTVKLRTCIGIAITGDGGILPHWMLHISATKFQANEQISKLKRDWSFMGPKKDVKIYLSSPHPDPCESDPGARDLIPQSQEIAELIERELKDLTGGTVRVIHRPARDNPTVDEGTMELDGDGTVYVEGNRVN
ncbi:uncharacterized protein KD926_001556 [Aspergillus affinis]|uniref:uncharacterized protein n=1 Tax=Aspergillus affinis TaxID=1070780 RepID=UPI0022FF022F|nr:uncharacterized protein KD926_001556 [Aspergillus affinis]KAI9044325.1 hypothetical protein KD926_001556 [Aspergillus affinis]